MIDLMKGDGMEDCRAVVHVTIQNNDYPEGDSRRYTRLAVGLYGSFAIDQRELALDQTFMNASREVEQLWKG